MTVLKQRNEAAHDNLLREAEKLVSILKDQETELISRHAALMESLKSIHDILCPLFGPNKTKKKAKLIKHQEIHEILCPPKKKAKLVKHHDDPPCNARLNPNGFCYECGVSPDMQSSVFYFYCPKCDVRLKNWGCPECGETFKRPSP